MDKYEIRPNWIINWYWISSISSLPFTFIHKSQLQTQNSIYASYKLSECISFNEENEIWYDFFGWHKTYLQKEYISNIIQLSKRKSEYYQVFVKLNLSVKSNSNISFCATTSSLWRLEALLIPYLLLSLVSLLFTTPFSSLTPFKDISRILLSKSNHHIEIYWITYSRRKQC